MLDVGVTFYGTHFPAMRFLRIPAVSVMELGFNATVHVDFDAVRLTNIEKACAETCASLMPGLFNMDFSFNIAMNMI